MGVAVVAGAAACGTDAAAIEGPSEDGGTVEADANATGTGSQADSGPESGPDAPTDANPGCASITCGSNATCSAASGAPVCTCNAGFAGDGASCTNVDDCASNPCLNGGTCADGVNAYTCACANGYSGSTCAILPPTCNAIKVANAGATTGVYTVDPDGSGGDDPFQVFCDMTTDGGGWTSVYKVSAGADVEATGLWTSATPVNAAAVDCSDPTTSGASSYCVNSFVTTFWNANGITLSSARVHAYKAGAVGAFLRFDALNTDKVAWFGQSLASSSWTDLVVGSPNYFSLGGDPQFGRTFFVNHNYDGCGSDAGWLVVSSIGGGQNKPCSWEQNAGAKTRILYSTGTTYTNWTTGTITAADTLMVFVK